MRKTESIQVWIDSDLLAFVRKFAAECGEDEAEFVTTVLDDRRITISAQKLMVPKRKERS